MKLPSQPWDEYSAVLFRDLQECEKYEEWEEADNIAEELLDYFLSGENNE